MNILAIGAHPDDLDAFCGGTLALYAQAGHHVVMCVATDGSGNPQGNPAEISAIRKAETQAAADLIGAQLVWLGLPDGRLTVNEAAHLQFVDMIRAAAPDLIITHPADDYHPDHIATHQLVIQSAQGSHTMNFPSAVSPLTRAMPIAFMDSERGINFLPEEYVDISSVWEVKVNMLKQHRSQFMPNRVYNPDYALPADLDFGMMRNMRIQSEFRGMSCGVSYAEGFRWWRVAHRILPKRLLP